MRNSNKIKSKTKHKKKNHEDHIYFTAMQNNKCLLNFDHSYTQQLYDKQTVHTNSFQTSTDIQESASCAEILSDITRDQPHQNSFTLTDETSMYNIQTQPLHNRITDMKLQNRCSKLENNNLEKQLTRMKNSLKTL